MPPRDNRDNLSFYEFQCSAEAVAIVSVPLELGSDDRGLAAAPAYLQERGLERMLAAIGREISKPVSVQCPKPRLIASAGTMKNAREIAGVAKRSRDAVEKAARAGSVVIALGGDHSVSIGTIAGAAAAHPSLGVIYIDAHPDCHTHETTISGNVHGMVTSALMGHGHPILADIVKRPIVSEHLLYIGLKDFDQAEIEYLRREGLACVTMLDIGKRGLSAACAAIDALSRKVDAVWISMDMDSIDEAYAPGVALCTKGGLTRREALALAQHIGMGCHVAGLDIVEMVPGKDVEGKTAALALELIAHFLGHEYSWYKDYMDAYEATNVTRARESA